MTTTKNRSKHTCGEHNMNYKAYSFDLRKDCVDIIMAGGGGHIGGGDRGRR